MPVITTKPVAEIQKEYAEALDGLGELIEKLREIREEIDFGPDLSDEGDLVLHQFSTAFRAVEAVSEFFPDLIPDNLLA